MDSLTEAVIRVIQKSEDKSYLVTVISDFTKKRNLSRYFSMSIEDLRKLAEELVRANP